MESSWQKFKDWVRWIVLAILIIHVIVFIFLNWTAKLDPGLHLIYRSYDRPSFLLVLILTSIISIFGWWLFRTSYKALRQLSESRDRGRLDKMERKMADTEAKAAMLQTRPVGEGASSGTNSGTH